MLLDAMKFDLRIVERNLRKGTVSREDYQKYLNKLPDSAENSTPIPAALGEPDTLKAVPTTNVENEEEDL